MSDTPERFPFKWQLGGIRRMNLELEAACETPGCGWFCGFNVAALIEKHGEDYWLPEYGPGFPCEQCGGHLNFQVAYLHPSAGGEKYR
jgi:hypothetical protein